jgi:hypothetical protein
MSPIFRVERRMVSRNVLAITTPIPIAKMGAPISGDIRPSNKATAAIMTHIVMPGASLTHPGRACPGRVEAAIVGGKVILGVLLGAKPDTRNFGALGSTAQDNV